jgi:hypothetical protein
MSDFRGAESFERTSGSACANGLHGGQLHSFIAVKSGPIRHTCVRDRNSGSNQQRANLRQKI